MKENQVGNRIAIPVQTFLPYAEHNLTIILRDAEDMPQQLKGRSRVRNTIWDDQAVFIINTGDAYYQSAHIPHTALR